MFFTAEGQAQSKKLARRKAAIVVLEEMKKVIEAEEKEKPQQGMFQYYSDYINKRRYIFIEKFCVDVVAGVDW